MVTHKIDWSDVRDRMEELLLTGMADDAAAMQVSRDLGGRPAKGTIMNRKRNGWEAPGSSVKSDLRQLQEEFQVLVDRLAEKDKQLEERDNEISRLLQRAAKAEGVSEVLREVASMDNGHA